MHAPSASCCAYLKFFSQCSEAVKNLQKFPKFKNNCSISYNISCYNISLLLARQVHIIFPALSVNQIKFLYWVFAGQAFPLVLISCFSFSFSLQLPWPSNRIFVLAQARSRCRRSLCCVCPIKFYSLCQRSNLRYFCQGCRRAPNRATLPAHPTVPDAFTVNRQRGQLQKQQREQEQLHLSSTLRTVEIFMLFAYCATWRQLLCITLWEDLVHSWEREVEMPRPCQQTMPTSNVHAPHFKANLRLA